MSVAPLAVEIVCVFLVAALLLHQYGNLRRQHLLATICTFIAWYFSFIIIFVLPLDVSSTFYRQCLHERHFLGARQSIPDALDVRNVTEEPVEPANDTTPTSVTPLLSTTFYPSEEICEVPWSHVPDHVLPDLWRVVYWTSQFLTWLLLPLMQSYTNAGDFNIAGKLKTSLIENAIWYGSYLLIFGVLLIYVAARPDIDLDGAKLKVICITASNTWGLFLLVLLLGYGLVEVPRSYWNSSKRGYMLSRTQFKITKLSTERSEAEEALEDVLEDVKRVHEQIRRSHPLRKHVDTIIEKCPEYVQTSLKQYRGGDDDGPARSLETPTEKSLARLHKQLITRSQNQHRTQCQWNLMIEKAFHLEDIARNEVNSERVFKPTFPPMSTSCWRMFYTPKIEWYWQCVLRCWVLRAAAVIFAMFSIIVVWSECTFFNASPVLSLFAIFIDLAKENYNFVYIELASCFTIAYLCVCAYYTIFKVRILNYYYLASHHQTDENSLLFSGM